MTGFAATTRWIAGAVNRTGAVEAFGRCEGALPFWGIEPGTGCRMIPAGGASSGAGFNCGVELCGRYTGGAGRDSILA